jgi:hypothetical protein
MIVGTVRFEDAMKRLRSGIKEHEPRVRVTRFDAVIVRSEPSREN